MTRALFTALLFLAVLTLAACNDDNGTVPVGTVDVSVRLTDATGKPLAGVKLMMMNDTPFFQDIRVRSAEKALSRVYYTMPTTGLARLTIEDVTGLTVRTLRDESLPAGTHSIFWDGKDDDGETLPSSRYKARLKVFGADGSLLGERTCDMLLAAIDERYPVGVTGADGVVRLRDPRLFPHIFDDSPQMARDENGEEMGEFTIGPTMIFYCVDEANQRAKTFRADVEVPGSVTLVWIDAPGPAPVRKAPVLPMPPVPVFDLSLEVFPNPFN